MIHVHYALCINLILIEDAHSKNLRKKRLINFASNEGLVLGATFFMS